MNGIEEFAATVGEAAFWVSLMKPLWVEFLTVAERMF